MRRAIADQVTEFKRASAARGPLVCAVTGQTSITRPQVFLALADDWAARVGGYLAIRLTSAADGQMGRELVPGDAEAWADFSPLERAPVHRVQAGQSLAAAETVVTTCGLTPQPARYRHLSGRPMATSTPGE